MFVFGRVGFWRRFTLGFRLALFALAVKFFQEVRVHLSPICLLIAEADLILGGSVQLVDMALWAGCW